MKKTRHAPEVLAVFALLLISTMPAYSAQTSMIDPNVQITLEYPDVVKKGDNFVVSSVIKSTADHVSNITLAISSPELDISSNIFKITNMTKDSTVGNDFKATVKGDTPDGQFVGNVQVTYYNKGLLDSNPVKNSFTQVFHINAQSRPIITIDAQAPDNVFYGEQFSIKGTINNQGVAAQNVQIQVSSDDINLDGKKSMTISNLDSGKKSDFELKINTPKDLDVPIHATMHITCTYGDESGKQYSVENSVNVFARHRGMLEIGDAQGIWLGNIFIAPVVGVGTIVSSVIGFFIFLWHYRNKRKIKKNKKTKR